MRLSAGRPHHPSTRFASYQLSLRLVCTSFGCKLIACALIWHVNRIELERMELLVLSSGSPLSQPHLICLDCISSIQHCQSQSVEQIHKLQCLQRCTHTHIATVSLSVLICVINNACNAGQDKRRREKEHTNERRKKATRISATWCWRAVTAILSRRESSIRSSSGPWLTFGSTVQIFHCLKQIERLPSSFLRAQIVLLSLTGSYCCRPDDGRAHFGFHFQFLITHT